MSQVIGLQIPIRSKVGKHDFDARPKNVEKWIESLPRASVGRCAELIYKLLKEVNGLNIRYKDRIRMLEALREPVQYVALAMQKHFVGVGFPLPVKNQKIAHASRKIHILMVIGYKIAIEDMLVNNVFMLDKNLLASLIHRSLSYMSRVILTTFQVYAPLPKNTWMDLHKLYGYAEKNNLLRNPISDKQHQYIKKTTISGEYCRILLLYLASPYRLRHGEVDKVYVNLERWMNKVSIHKVSDKQQQCSDFILDIHSDEAPCYLVLKQDSLKNKNVRVINTQELTQELYDELQQSEEIVSRTLITINMPKASLQHDLLRRLNRAWGALPKRAGERNECQKIVNVAIGLSATHQAILKYSNETDDFSYVVSEDDSQLLMALNQQSDFQAKDVVSESEQTPDVWEMVYNNGKLQLVNADEKINHSVENKLNNSIFDTMDSWNLTNLSEQGFSIQCNMDCGSSVQVGEILAMQMSTDDSEVQWQIGIIRWMRIPGETGVQLGGQFIGRTAIPVGICMAMDDVTTSQIQRALLLPAVKSSSRASTLITLTSPYRVGAIIIVYLAAGTLRVKLTSEHDDTGLYSEFEYELIDVERPAKDIKEPQNSGDKDYDDVWSSL